MEIASFDCSGLVFEFSKGDYAAGGLPSGYDILYQQ